ncbi:unnamed protein product [Clonostachys byssicola]|uniref:Amidase domain-containing protein n=1 Tax=Clonostachys byssicola TaxID=160290 RepID=A0A9N9U9Q2_9HYPO|nr:unnamed protein product [Clonostachys byssicola]
MRQSTSYIMVLWSVIVASIMGFILTEEMPHPFPMSLCNGVNIEDATVKELQHLMSIGQLSSQDLVECYIKRINQTNEFLRSVSEVNPDALSIASALDQERNERGIRGPFHGIPFLVKDNIYTDDKHNTSEGGLVLLGGRYSSEATLVTKLRAAGGVLLGHAALSEAADHRALTNFSDGYSTRVGQTRNPFNLTQATSGSSGGSAVAVRSNQAAIAIGTETHGSLVHPSANLGLYTIKTTPGLVSRHGVVPGSYYHDTPGPMARSMTDVAIVLDIIASPDHRDNLTFNALGKIPLEGYAAALGTSHALRGMRLGLPWNPYWSTAGNINAPGLREQYESRLQELKAAGVELYNITNNPYLHQIANPYGFGQPAHTPEEYNQLISYKTLLAVALGEWLQNWTFPETDERHGMSTLAEMASWNDEHNATTGALGNGTWWYNTESGQDFYDIAIATNGSLNGTFWKAFGWGRRIARQAIDFGHTHAFENGTVIELDALLLPNNPNGGFDNGCASVPSYAGYPVASVPIGQSKWGMPIGFCIHGREYSEAKLIKVASALENLFRWNAVPQWHNYKTAEGPWDAPWPGYACSQESLDSYACERS